AVLLAFVPMALLGISSNIMSLAGIAISIGVLVDGAIVEVENAHKKLELWERGGPRGGFHPWGGGRLDRGGREPPQEAGAGGARRPPRGVPAVRLEALLEVGPAVFFSLLV